MKNSILKSFTKEELFLWLSSVSAVLLSYIALPSGNVLCLIASLVGVTALIFVAKGYVIGQVLTVIFSIMYGIISFEMRYFGEMITYLGMTAPVAVLAVIEWMRHPFKGSREVKVRRLSGKHYFVMFILTGIITIMFYFILRYFDTANLFLSTVSVATSFIASYLTMMRSPLYGIGYGMNDIVLILLWLLASLEDQSYFPVLVCFFVFLINDIYGFFNWRNIEKKQRDQ